MQSKRAAEQAQVRDAAAKAKIQKDYQAKTAELQKQHQAEKQQLTERHKQDTEQVKKAAKPRRRSRPRRSKRKRTIRSRAGELSFYRTLHVGPEKHLLGADDEEKAP